MQDLVATTGALKNHNTTMNVCGFINSELQNFPIFGNCDDDSLVMYNSSANGYIQMV